MRILPTFPLSILRVLLRFRAVLPALIFCLGALSTVLVWQSSQAQLRERRLAAFEFQANKLARQLDAHLLATTQVLRGVAGLFAASEEVNRAEFRQYVDALRLGDRYPGIQGIGFARQFSAAELAGHEAQLRAQGFGHYAVRPEGLRERHAAIIYLEPFDWRNQRAFGFDMLSEPVRRAAMERARDSDQAALSGRVLLEQETAEDPQSGVLLYVPVYRTGEELASIEQRRAGLLGWTFAALRVKDLMSGVLARESSDFYEQFVIELYDSDHVDADCLMFRSAHWAQADSAGLQMSQSLRVAGQAWTLQARALPGYASHFNGLQGRGFLLAGTLASALLAALVAFILNSHARISAALAETDKAHQLLSQSQAQLQSIFDTSGVGMLQVDVRGGITRVNQRMAEMFGYERSLMPGMRYEDLVPPEEGEVVRQRTCELVASEIKEINLERFYRRADGGQFWGMVSARRLLDSQGATIGLVGVIVDLNARRDAEQRLMQSEQRYRTLTESMKDVVWSLDLDTMQLTYCSPSVQALCAYSPEEVCAGGLVLLFGEARAQRLQQTLRARVAQYLAGELPPAHAWLDELEHVRRDGSLVPAEVSSSLEPDPLSGMLILRGVTRNITERKLHEQAQRVAAVAFESHESMLVTDLEGTILQVNRAFTELTGFSLAEALGKTPRLLHSGRHDSEFYANMWCSINASGFWQGEIWNRHKDGRVYPVWLTITAVRDDDGRTTHYVGSSFDITRQVQHQSEIRNLAFYDPLTGLANRRLFTDRLGHAFAKSGRSKLFGAVLYIDLDRFKDVNDTLGHGEGDRLLELVADRIATNVREGDTVARFGGDEFVVLLEDAGAEREEALEAVLAVAEKLRLALELPYRLHGVKGGDWVCSSSIGVAVFRGSQEEMESVLLRADRALYVAKERGRNAVCVGDSGETASGGKLA